MIFGPRPESHILPTERRVVRLRPHWASLWRPVGQGLLALAVLWGINWLLGLIGSAVATLMMIVWLFEFGAILFMTYHIVFWWEERLMITDKRFLKVTGVFTETINMMPLTKVTDMTHHRSLVGRILGFGTIRIESAGQQQALEYLPYLPDVLAVYTAVNKLVFGEKEESGGLPRPKRGPFRNKSSRAVDRDEHVPNIDDLSDEWQDD